MNDAQINKLKADLGLGRTPPEDIPYITAMALLMIVQQLMAMNEREAERP